MDSDSDSDGSHVSATSPRDPFPPPPPRISQQPPPRQVPPVSRKVASSSSRSKPIAPKQQQPPDHLEEAPVPSSSSLPSPLFTNLPFRICEPSNLSQPTGVSSSVLSFYRLRKASLTSEEKSTPECQSDAVNCVPELPHVVIDPPKPVRRKPPNLFTDSVTSLLESSGVS
ncbi:unnamed protein product [Microthlaspi erraticum]|uniref:Uncharacterized protein n=1 Tax=Microthlaspi erraticum TaxID=1685480 RepID=A0A6D2K259_9BRAS|nr:unnamed protein product [Microthlaspi erraticum]